MKQKTLILIRHGKSIERSEFEWNDFDRPLTLEGGKELETFFKTIKKWAIIDPEYIVTSEAKRCYETAEVFGDIFKVDSKNIKKDINLYVQDDDKKKIEDYYKAIDSFDENFHTCVLVGHNATLSNFASDICGEKLYMKKGSILILEIKKHGTWGKIDTESAKLLAYITPDIL